MSQVARDLDLAQSVVCGWVKQARADRSKGKTGLTTEERAELASLPKQVRELKLERDLLKKWRPSSPKRVREVRIHRGGEGRR